MATNLNRHGGQFKQNNQTTKRRNNTSLQKVEFIRNQISVCSGVLLLQSTAWFNLWWLMLSNINIMYWLLVAKVVSIQHFQDSENMLSFQTAKQEKGTASL